MEFGYLKKSIGFLATFTFLMQLVFCLAAINLKLKFLKLHIHTTETLCLCFLQHAMNSTAPAAENTNLHTMKLQLYCLLVISQLNVNDYS